MERGCQQNDSLADGAGAMRMVGLSESAYWASFQLLFVATSLLAALIAAAVGRLTSCHPFIQTDFGVLVCRTLTQPRVLEPLQRPPFHPATFSDGNTAFSHVRCWCTSCTSSR